MLFNVINNLTKQQREFLYENGVPHSRMSEWRKKKRLPTYEQCVTLSEVTGCDLKELLFDVAMRDANEAQKKHFGYEEKGLIAPFFLLIFVVLSILFSSFTYSLKPASSNDFREIKEVLNVYVLCQID